MIGGDYTLHVACDYPGCTTHTRWHGDDREEAIGCARRGHWRVWIFTATCVCPEHNATTALQLTEMLAVEHEKQKRLQAERDARAVELSA